MFGLFKKNDMSSALDECQTYHKKLGLDQELTQVQLVLIRNMALFADIESRHKSKGLTKYGALAWFTGQALVNTLKCIDEGSVISQQHKDLTQKLAFVGLAIGNSIPELKLTKADMGPIQNAAEAAMVWSERYFLNGDLLAELGK